MSFRAAFLVLAGVFAGCGHRADRSVPLFPSARDGAPGLECAAPWTFDPEHGCSDRDPHPNLEVTHRDRMSDAFVLESASYSLDGQPLARFDAPADDAPGEKGFDVGRFQVSARSHTLAVHLTYRGHGTGVFSYLRGYRFEVRSATQVTVSSAPMLLVVDAHERGGVTTPLEERPAVTFLTGSPAAAAD